MLSQDTREDLLDCFTDERAEALDAGHSVPAWASDAITCLREGGELSSEALAYARTSYGIVV